MRFFKLTVFIFTAGYSAWTFAENIESQKNNEKIQNLIIEISAKSAKKSTNNFIKGTLTRSENPLNEFKNLSDEQKIKNEIAQAINDNTTPNFFDEKIKNLNEETEKLEQKLKSQKADYLKDVNSIPDYEKRFGFNYENKIVKIPIGKSGIYFLTTLSIFCFILLYTIKTKVISVRRRWRTVEPEQTITFRWIGFSWLLPILICSCQSGNENDNDFFNPSKFMEVEKQKLVERLENIKKTTEEVTSDLKTKSSKEQLLQKCSEYLEAFLYRENLNKELIINQDELQKLKDDLKILEDESTLLRINTRVKDSIFFYLIIASIFISAFFVFLTKNHSANNSKLCPRCFEFGTLKEAPEDKNQLQCISKFCKDNTFRLPKRFQAFPKLSFPMIGCGSSGKTHWLLNIYSSNIDSAVATKKKSALYKIDVAYNVEFNKRKQALTEQTSGGASVQPKLSSATPPLIFALNDNQNLPLGLPYLFQSHGLSLCFDYAGELRNDSYKETQEMVSRSNGLVFFLDVMNVDKTQIDFTNWKNNKLNKILVSNNYDTQNQTDVIGKTYSDFVIARNLTEPNPLDLPVAICLSKIDLLPYQGPLKGSYGEKFKKDIENCKHPANKWSLSTIMKRSDIIRNYLPLIFAHKGMIEIFDQKFGSNYMFFPVANRGLDPNLSFGEPFGVMEPLLWLQHMHGFNVFDA